VQTDFCFFSDSPNILVGTLRVLGLKCHHLDHLPSRLNLFNEKKKITSKHTNPKNPKKSQKKIKGFFWERFSDFWDFWVKFGKNFQNFGIFGLFLGFLGWVWVFWVLFWLE
jgi:hypothetical protein